MANVLPESPADHVHLNLLENGLDFLLSAAEAVQTR